MEMKMRARWGLSANEKKIGQFFYLWPIKLRARCSQLLSGAFVERFRRHAHDMTNLLDLTGYRIIDVFVSVPSGALLYTRPSHAQDNNGHVRRI